MINCTLFLYTKRTPNSGSICMGTDMNRNYGYMWNTGGTSSNPCSDTYLGKAPNSEPEVQNVQKFVSKVQDKVKFYQSLHFLTWDHVIIAERWEMFVALSAKNGIVLKNVKSMIGQGTS